MMNFYQLALASHLPPRLTIGLLHYAKRLPYQKYSKRDFKRCIAGCSGVLIRYYKHEVTKELCYFLGRFIHLLGELYESATMLGLPTRQSLIGSEAQASPFGDTGQREEPPPD